MTVLAGLSIYHQHVVKERDVRRITESLKKDELFHDCLASVRNEALSHARQPTHFDKNSFSTLLKQILDQQSLTPKIRNFIYAKVQQYNLEAAPYRNVACPEYPLPPLHGAHPCSLAVIENLFQSWSEMLFQESVALAKEQRQPFLRERVKTDQGQTGDKRVGGAGAGIGPQVG